MPQNAAINFETIILSTGGYQFIYLFIYFIHQSTSRKRFAISQEKKSQTKPTNSAAGVNDVTVSWY